MADQPPNFLSDDSLNFNSNEYSADSSFDESELTEEELIPFEEEELTDEPIIIENEPKSEFDQLIADNDPNNAEGFPDDPDVSFGQSLLQDAAGDDGGTNLTPVTAKGKFLNDYYKNKTEGDNSSGSKFSLIQNARIRPDLINIHNTNANQDANQDNDPSEIDDGNQIDPPPIVDFPEIPQITPPIDNEDEKGEKNEESKAYESSERGGVYSKYPLHFADTGYVIRSPTEIPFLFAGDVTTDQIGFAIGIIHEDVYDSIRFKDVLIPAGSKLILDYDTSISKKDTRMRLIAVRLLFPDEHSLLLDNILVYDMSGFAGLGEGDVEIDRHFDDTAVGLGGGAIASLLLGKGADIFGFNSTVSVGGNIAAEYGSRAIDLIIDDLEGLVGKPPTFTVKAGTEAKIILRSDIKLKPYQRRKT